MIDFYNPFLPSQKLRQEDSWLICPVTDRRFPIVNGIPRFVDYHDAGQMQTSHSFGFKWTKHKEWGFKDEHRAVVWSIWKDFFGWESDAPLRALMTGRRVLDAGCGSGASLHYFADWPSEIIAADISEAVDACAQNFAQARNLTIVQADLRHLPFQNESFDVVYVNGVLHHTPDTYESFRSLLRLLRPGGKILVYIYVKKAPIREFVDDYLRGIVSDMPEERAWEVMERLTHFSKALAETNARITLEKDVPELGFQKGEYNLQRFLYYNVLKCFWNPDMAFEYNVHVNFDWYHPKYAHRHTPEEVRQWLADQNLREEYFFVSPSGIGFIAERKS